MRCPCPVSVKPVAAGDVVDLLTALQVVTLYFQLPVPHICRRQQMWDCTLGPSVIYCRLSVWVKSDTLTLAPRLGVNPSCSCINRHRLSWFDGVGSWLLT